MAAARLSRIRYMAELWFVVERVDWLVPCVSRSAANVMSTVPLTNIMRVSSSRSAPCVASMPPAPDAGSGAVCPAIASRVTASLSAAAACANVAEVIG